MTIFWQSSNEPLTSYASTLPPQLVSCARCLSATLPFGNRTFTERFSLPKKADATAPPVSPLVATRIVFFSPLFLSSLSIVHARNLAPKSLNALVGPKISSIYKYLSFEVWKGRGKEKASRHISSNSSSSSSPSKNGFMARYIAVLSPFSTV